MKQNKQLRTSSLSWIGRAIVALGGFILLAGFVMLALAILGAFGVVEVETLMRNTFLLEGAMLTLGVLDIIAGIILSSYSTKEINPGASRNR